MQIWSKRKLFSSLALGCTMPLLAFSQFRSAAQVRFDAGEVTPASNLNAGSPAASAVSATEDFVSRITKELRQRPGFRIRLKFDDNKKVLGPLYEGEGRVILPLKSDMTFPFNKEDPEKGEVVFTSAGIDVMGDLKLSEDGNFEGRLRFQKMGASTELETTIKFRGSGLLFRFSSIDFKGSGLQSQGQNIVLAGDCGLRQMILDEVGQRGQDFPEVWAPADCEYEFKWDPVANRFRMKFNLNSLNPKKKNGV